MEQKHERCAQVFARSANAESCMWTGDQDSLYGACELETE